MPDLVVKFLDVGQGDSTLVVLPNGDGVLVDCAAGAAPYVVEQLEQTQVTNLELMVITHSDQDHAGGCMDVVKSFGGQILRLAILHDRVLNSNEQSNKRYRVLLRDLVSQLLRCKTKRWLPYAGKSILLGEVTFSVLHPSDVDHLDAVACGNPNDSSIVLMIEYAGSRILLGSDVQRRGWQWMLERDTDLKADVFKFPHHGAWYSGEPSLQKVMERVDPAVVVISVGTSNSYGHPSPETLRLLRSLQGSVRFMCTAATPQCHGTPEAMSTQVRELMPPESQGGYSYKKPQFCPCAGHVTIHISSSGVEVHPTPEQHGRVIELFETPQCRDESA